MAQYNKSGKSGTSTGFFSKIRVNYGSKISNIKPSSEKDGNSEDDTLINSAFIRYFDDNNLPYPEWLGVPQRQNQQQKQASYNNSQSQYGNSQYRPVQHSNQFNNNYSQQQATRNSQPLQSSMNSIETNDDTGRPMYQRRTSSRLEDLHNRSRQQSIPGSGYSSQAYQVSTSKNGGSSTSRLRERMLNQNQPSMYSSNIGSQQSSTSRSTWNR